MTNAEKPEMKNLKNLISKYKNKPSIMDNTPFKNSSNRNNKIELMKKISYATVDNSNRDRDSIKNEFNNIDFYTNRGTNELQLDKIELNRLKGVNTVILSKEGIKKKNSEYFQKNTNKNISKGIENSYSTLNNNINGTNKIIFNKIISNTKDDKDYSSNISFHDRSQISYSRKNSFTNNDSNLSYITANKNSSKAVFTSKTNANPLIVKKNISKIKQIPLPINNLTQNTNGLSNPSNISNKNLNQISVPLDLNSNSKNNSELKSEADMSYLTIKETQKPVNNINIMACIKNTNKIIKKSRGEINQENEGIKTNREVAKINLSKKIPKDEVIGIKAPLKNENLSIYPKSIPIATEDRGLVEEFITASNEKANDQMININISPIIRRKPKPKNVKKLNNFKINLQIISKFIELIQCDLTQIFKVCKAWNNLIKEEFKKMSEKILTDFENLYADAFEILSKSIIYEENKSKKLTVNLLIQARLKLAENMYANNITISDVTKYIGEKYLYKNMYKFDYKSPDTPFITWIMGEHSKLQNNDFNTAFVQPILNFTNKDIFNISVTLLSPRGLIDVSSHNWNKLVITPLQKVDFVNFNEGHRYREIVDLNLSRFCELELTKNKWIDICLSKDESVCKYAKNIQNLLFPMFLVNKMQYDDLGIFYFKIYAIANKTGIYKADSQISVNLVVKDSQKSIKNEIKKNGLIFDRSNSLELRIGDVIVFFFSVSKDFLHSFFKP